MEGCAIDECCMKTQICLQRVADVSMLTSAKSLSFQRARTCAEHFKKLSWPLCQPSMRGTRGVTELLHEVVTSIVMTLLSRVSLSTVLHSASCSKAVVK